MREDHIRLLHLEDGGLDRNARTREGGAFDLPERVTPVTDSAMNSPTVFDCFCGLGGLSLGAELAGFEIIGGVDADKAAAAMYSRTFPGKLALENDLLKERPSDVLRNAGISRGDVDVLVGGPPCQPYSINNHQRGTDDARCALVDSYLEFVSVLQPRWLLIENVPGFASIEHGRFLQWLLRALRSRRYFADFAILEATRFSVPQRRKRLVIIAGKARAKLREVLAALQEHKGDVFNVGQAFADLPIEQGEHAAYRSEPMNSFQIIMRHGQGRVVQGHLATNLGVRNLRRIQHVPPGGNWRDIPRRFLPPGMRRARLSDHTTRYGRLHKRRPAFTLLTKCDPHWGCFVHPTRDRVITVREAARLQSIPDHVEFLDSLVTNYRLIGNAVPPLLGKGILKYLE